MQNKINQIIALGFLLSLLLSPMHSYSQKTTVSGAKIHVKQGTSVNFGNQEVVFSEAEINNSGIFVLNKDLTADGLTLYNGEGLLIFQGDEMQSITLPDTIANIILQNNENLNILSGIIISDSLELVEGKVICNEYNLELLQNAVIEANENNYIVTNSTGLLTQQMGFYPIGTEDNYSPIELTGSGMAVGARTLDSTGVAGRDELGRMWVIATANPSEVSGNVWWNSTIEPTNFDRDEANVEWQNADNQAGTLDEEPILNSDNFYQIPFTITTSGNTSILLFSEELEFLPFDCKLLYPNPTTESLVLDQLTSVRNNTEFKIEVYNHVGQKMLDQTYSTGTANQIELDVSKLNLGAYILKISDGEKSCEERFVKY